MLKRQGYVGLSIAWACTSAMLPAPHAYAEQQPAAPSAAGQAPAPAAASSIPGEQAESKPILEGKTGKSFFFYEILEQVCLQTKSL